MSEPTTVELLEAAPAMTGLRARLDRMEAIAAIGDLVARYARGADRRNDRALLGPLYHEQAVWECEGFGRFAGRAAILDAVEAIARERILWSVHYMVAPLIELAADAATATCSWYLWELTKLRGDDGVTRDTWLAGYYDSTVSRGASGWRFDHVRLDVRLISATDAPWHPASGHPTSGQPRTQDQPS
jgi:hypothetical protein